MIDRPPGEKVITTRWADVNKGDEVKKKYRSRLLPREVKLKPDVPASDSWQDFFASMPTVTALRGGFALGQEIHALFFVGVKKAHFWSPAKRRLLIELRDCMGFLPGKVDLLKRSLCGARDAPANWEAAIREVMLSIGFLKSRKLRRILVCTATPRSSRFDLECMVMTLQDRATMVRRAFEEALGY